MDRLFCQNMNSLRNKFQYSFTDLSEICRLKGIELSAPTLQRYESGKIKNVPYDSIIVLSEIFNVSPISLVGWDKLYCQTKYSSQEQDIINKYRQLSDDNKEEIKMLINFKLDTQKENACPTHVEAM